MTRGLTAAGLDPGLFALGGDPAAIRGSAAGWQAFGLRAGVAAVAVRAVAAVSAAEFSGDEGQAHTDRLRTDVAAGLAIVADAWTRVGRALTTYAGELEECQTELRGLDAQADSARRTVAMRLVDPAAGPALTEAQLALDAIDRRALAVRTRHDEAQRNCCGAIDTARSLAPKPPPGVRGTARTGRYVLASVAEVPQLVSLRRGLKVVSGSTATMSLHPVLAEPATPDSGSGEDPIVPAQGSTDQLRKRIYDACTQDLGGSLIGTVDPQVELDCTGIADTAITDPYAMEVARSKWPWAVNPAGPMPGGWAAIRDYLGYVGSFAADLAGLSDCLERKIGPCLADVAMNLIPGGRVVARTADELAAAAARLEALSAPVQRRIDNAARKQAEKNAAKEAKAAAAAAKAAREKRIADMRAAVKPGPGQETVPEEWLDTVADKVPSDGWLPPKRGKKRKDSSGRVSLRLTDDKGNNVRIDLAQPNSPWPSQRVDHVVIQSNGQTIGRNGEKLTAANVPEAHVPFDEWKNWSSWDHP